MTNTNEMAIRDTFKGYNIKPYITTCGRKEKATGLSDINTELFISNF